VPRARFARVGLRPPDTAASPGERCSYHSRYLACRTLKRGFKVSEVRRVLSSRVLSLVTRHLSLGMVREEGLESAARFARRGLRPRPTLICRRGRFPAPLLGVLTRPSRPIVCEVLSEIDGAKGGGSLRPLAAASAGLRPLVGTLKRGRASAIRTQSEVGCPASEENFLNYFGEVSLKF